MTITFEITRSDLLAYLAESNARLGVSRQAYRRGFLWGPVLACVAVFILRLNDPWAVVAVVVTVVGAYAAFWRHAWPASVTRTHNALLDEGFMRNEIGRHSISLIDDGLREADWGTISGDGRRSRVCP